MRHTQRFTVLAGEFREKIEILNAPALNDYNEPVGTWTVAASHRAQYNAQSVSRKFDGGQDTAINRVMFRVRRTDATKADRVRYRSEDYEILGIQKVGPGAGNYVEIMCEKIEQ